MHFPVCLGAFQKKLGAFLIFVVHFGRKLGALTEIVVHFRKTVVHNWLACKSFVMRRLSGNKTQGFRRILNSCHLVTEFLVIRSDYGVALFRPRCSVSSLVVWLKLLFPKALQRGHSIFAAVFFRFLIQVNRPVQILFHTQALFI